MIDNNYYITHSRQSLPMNVKKNFKLSSSNHQSMKVIDFGQGILEKNEDISSAIFQKL